jgi:Flp pilus assembly protein TadB
MATFVALAFGALAFIVAAIVLRIERPAATRNIAAVPVDGPVDRYLRRLGYDLNEAGFEGLSPARFTLYSLIAAVAVSAVVIPLGYALVAATVSVLLATVWIRSVFVGGRARANREWTTAKAAEVARDLASQLDAGSSANEALRSIADQGREGGISEATSGRQNRVARAIAEAIRLSETGPTIEDALRTAAADLGNQAFVEVVEAFVLNARESRASLSMALVRTAGSIEARIRIRDKRRTLLRESMNSVQTMGYVIAFLVVIMNLLLPGGRAFYMSSLGQVVLLVGAGIWYAGYRIITSSAEGADR